VDTTALAYFHPGITSGGIEIRLWGTPRVLDDRTPQEAWQRSVFSDPEVTEWAPLANRNAGIRESQWLSEHRTEILQQYANRWIAVFADRVIASGESFGEVYQNLINRNIRDALIEHIPNDASMWDNLIA
jgi:hypothetical protein